MEASALRERVEESLRGRISLPFAIRGSSVTAMAPCGISELDELTGGLPRGCVTEIFGPPGSGRSSFLVSVLAGMTRRKEFCVLVDGRSSFDPRGAQAAGVALERLLWVRCSNIEETLRCADLLLHGGGFGMVAVDLCDLPERLVRRVPMSTWFRFRQLVENTPTVCLLMGQQAGAKSCAALVMRLEMQAAKWRGEREGSGGENPQRVLLEGMEAGAEVVLSRMERNAFEKMDRTECMRRRR
jgi:recombination protein RecA